MEGARSDSGAEAQEWSAASTQPRKARRRRLRLSKPPPEAPSSMRRTTSSKFQRKSGACPTEYNCRFLHRKSRLAPVLRQNNQHKPGKPAHPASTTIFSITSEATLGFLRHQPRNARIESRTFCFGESAFSAALSRIPFICSRQSSAIS